VSIGKRLINLVRANIHSVLDRPGRSSVSKPLEDLSDYELEAELNRRRQRRDAAERAASEDYSKAAWEEVEEAMRGGERYRRTGRRRTGNYRRYTGGGGSRRQGTRDPRLAQLYAQLECPYGADLTTVRKHYRTMMRKYHPDMHSGSPEKQRVATDLSQRLTMAYNELRRLLSSS
jgi:DnaJ-domain-containing protein 1